MINDVPRFVWTLGPDGEGGAQWGVGGTGISQISKALKDYPLVMVLEKDFDKVAEENECLKRQIAQLRESSHECMFEE